MTEAKEAVFSRQVLKDYIMISVGAFVLAYGIIAFWAKMDLVTGGLSGLAIILAEYSYRMGFPIPIWLSNLVFNVPILIVGYIVIPTRYFVRTVYGSLFLAFSLWVCEFLPIPSSDMLLSSVFGGVVAGLGLGLVFRAMGTTGGTTLAAEVIKRKFFKHLPLASVLFVVDSAIIAVGFMAFGPVNTMYAIIGIFVCARVTNTMIEGMHFSKAAFIISKESETITKTILADMNRGVTAMDSRGMFTKEPRSMLLCVVSAKEIIDLKQLVYSIDEKAFVIVADVREVLGEGFKKGKEVY